METELIEKAVLKFVPKEHIYCSTNRVIYIHKENRQEGRQEFRKKTGGFPENNTRSAGKKRDKIRIFNWDRKTY